MSLSMSQASRATFAPMLEALSGLLDKAERHAAASRIPPETLLEARLAPDMFPLTRQVQIATDQAKGATARLAGLPVPSLPDTETSFAELQARIRRVLDLIADIDPAAIDGSEERPITIKAGAYTFSFTGQDYLFRWALPNFYFHVTTAYDILRAQGLPLGKADFLAGLQPTAS